MTYKKARELCEIVVELHNILDDEESVAKWLTTENPHLGEMTPWNLIERERGHKVLAFVRSMDPDRAVDRG